MRRAHDLLGRRFGRWAVIASAPKKNNRPTWLCRCECGTERAIHAWNLTTGLSKSCGCWRDEFRLTHGHSSRKHLGRAQSSTYSIWAQMLQRCENSNSDHFSDYGGRGIRVCDSWRSFHLFLADMGERPPGRSIDRIDNDLDYGPLNCRWATPKEQTANRLRSSPAERLAFRNRRAWARIEGATADY